MWKQKLRRSFNHVLRIAQFYDIELSQAFRNKMEKTGKKYPVERAKSSNQKYDRLG